MNNDLYILRSEVEYRSQRSGRPVVRRTGGRRSQWLRRIVSADPAVSGKDF